MKKIKREDQVLKKYTQEKTRNRHNKEKQI